MRPCPKPNRAVRLVTEAAIREETILRRAELRHEVLLRAGFRCENPDCRRDLRKHGCVMDHWLGGSGRREQAERHETLWAICGWCNERRTANVPTADYWNTQHERHCTAHGYAFVPPATRLEALAEAGRVTR